MFNYIQPPIKAITINNNTVSELTEANFEAFLENLEIGHITFLQIATAAAQSIGLPAQRYTGIYHRYTEGLQNMLFFPLSDDTKVYKKYRTSAESAWSAWVSG